MVQLWQRQLPLSPLAPRGRLADSRAMTVELSVLAWGCVLAILHIFIAVRFKTRQYGGKWNRGARDEDLPPPQPIVGRLARAQAISSRPSRSPPRRS
jgi:hypothetical protein